MVGALRNMALESSAERDKQSVDVGYGVVEGDGGVMNAESRVGDDVDKTDAHGREVACLRCDVVAALLSGVVLGLLIAMMAGGWVRVGGVPFGLQALFQPPCPSATRVNGSDAADGSTSYFRYRHPGSEGGGGVSPWVSPSPTPNPTLTSTPTSTPTPSPSGVPMPTNAPAYDGEAPARAIVVVSNGGGNEAAWLIRYFSDMCILAYSHDDDTHRPFVALPNVGLEATIYLQFIVDHYHNLPNATAFLHGPSSEWHTRDLVPILRRFKWGEVEFGHINYLTESDQFNEAMRQRIERPNNNYQTIVDSWDDFFGEFLGPLPPFFDTNCCAQFVVSRRAITRLPKAFYERALQWFQTQTRFEPKIAAILFEHIWRFIFTGQHEYAFAATLYDELCRVVHCPLDGPWFPAHERHPSRYPCDPRARRMLARMDQNVTGSWHVAGRGLAQVGWAS